jgi:hypothetical protein
VQRGSFRFAVVLSLLLAAAAVVVALAYDLPLRDPDGVSVPTYVRLPVILFIAFLTDVLPRVAWRMRATRSARQVPRTFTDVVRERWHWEHVRFALVGLGAWYLTYVAFRNLKSFVPFVNHRMYDGALASFDRTLWLGHDPATVMHSLLGTGWAAHAMSFIYIAWIVFVPMSLVMALVWSRDVTGGAFYVTAVAVDWVLGAATYFLVPTLGPVYARPHLFEGLAHTDVSSLQVTMIAERHQVLANPFSTDAVQTIAAFASLHVGIMVTVCIMAQLLGMHRWVRRGLWVFLFLTVVATVYLGWHYFADALGGAVLGAAGVWIAALGTGNHVRGRPRVLDREPAGAGAAGTAPGRRWVPLAPPAHWLTK